MQYSSDGRYTISTHSRIQNTKTVNKEGVLPPIKSPNHSNLEIKILHTSRQGVSGYSPQALVAQFQGLPVDPLQVEESFSFRGHSTTHNGVLCQLTYLRR